MIIDCHVHTAALVPAHGFTSRRLLESIGFRFMRWRLGIPGVAPTDEALLEARLADTIRTSGLNAAVILAFDAPHHDDGRLDSANTHLYVTNDHALAMTRQYRGMLFGASVHPYRKDALTELERCIAAGAVLMKWLPLTQKLNPADERCFPLYEAMAHHKVPLLSHTGYESALPTLDWSVADPMLLEPALKRGVTVIAAHCGTRALPWQRSYLPEFIQLARDYEHFYGDTSALNLPTRCYAWDALLEDRPIRCKLVHGSDWPIMPLPPLRVLGPGHFRDMLLEPNWMKRDILIKRRLGLVEDEYWDRAGTILRLPGRQ